MPTLLRRTLFGVGIAMAAPASAVTNRAPDLILYNGVIWAGKGLSANSEAIAISKGKIAAIGRNSDILSLKGPKTRLIDVQGRRIIPGINDAHDHAGSASPGIEVRTQPPAEANASLDILVSAIATATATAQKGQWLFATAGPAVMSDPVNSLRAIEAVTADHPVIVMAWWGHGVLLNAAAQKWAGVDPSAPDPLGGWLDRDAQHRFTGRLDEYAGAAVWRRLSTTVPLSDHASAFRSYASRRFKDGVTSVQLMTTSQTPDALARTVAVADTALKVRLIHFVIPAEDGVTPLKARRISDTLRIDGVKYVLDGTPIDQFAYRSTDYQGRPGWRGRLNFTPAFIRDRLQAALTGDQPLLLHVVGDAAAVHVLDTMESLAPASQWQGKRLRLEHGNGIVGPNIARAQAMGVIVAQGRPTAPYKNWRDADLRVAYGSDTGFGPWMMMKAMTAENNPQSVSREEALDILTCGPAWAEFREREKGRLEPGYCADLAVLSQDVLSCAADVVDKTQSVLTIIDGRVVYSAMGSTASAS